MANGNGLGLGAGLSAGAQQGFKQAVAGGTASDWLGQHQQAAQKIRQSGVTSGDSTGAQNYTNYMTTNAANAQKNAQAAAPQGNAATAAPKGGGGGATTPPANTQPAAAATPAANPTFQSTLDTQFGTGNPFGMQDWYGGNPLQTATDLANRNLSSQLAQVRARYAGSGGGTSGREAVAEGTAVGDATTGLGDVMASRGIQARQGDVQAALQAILGAGNQQLQGQANQVNYANALANQGNQLNQIGALEQQVPNAALLTQLLGLFSQTTGTGQTSTSQNTQGGFLGM